MLAARGTKTTGHSEMWLNSGEFRFYATDLGTGVYQNSGISVGDNVWHHLVATYDNANARFYVDGVLRKTNALAGSIGTSTRGFDIGRVNDASPLYYPGLLDDVRFYNRALTLGEINRLYQLAQPKINATQTTLDQGLVGHWTFDGRDMSGTRAKDRVGTNHGTLTSGPVQIIGRIGQALSFDGTDDYISTTTLVGNPTTTTVSAWFKTGTASGHKIVGLESNQTGTASALFDRHLYMGTDSKIYFGVFDTAARSVTSTSTLTNNAWHHAVGTDNGSTIALYIDGVLQGTTSGTGYASYVTSYWRIGSYRFGSNTWTNASDGYFTGSIDDVRIYNRALSAGEVQKLYQWGR